MISKKEKKTVDNINKIGGFFKRYKYEFLVFLFFVLVRIPSLGHDNFNTDAWRWKSRSYNFGNAITSGKFENTLQKYHPGVILMWLGSAGVKINNTYANLKGQSLVADESVDIIFQLDFVQKLLVVCAQGIAVTFVFYVLRNIFGYKYSMIAIFMLSLEPFYLGLTRVFHLEGLVSSFMLASIIWLYYYLLNTKNWKRLAVSSVFAGFSLLTKTSSIFLIPFSALTLFIYVFRNGKSKNLKEYFKKELWNNIKNFNRIFLFWFTIVFMTFFVFWPAMWVSMTGVFQALYEGIVDVGVEGDHLQYYFGKLVDDPGPSFYFVVFGFRSSTYLFIGFIGSLLIRNKLPRYYKNFLDYLLVFVFFIFLQLTIPSKKLDRYILPMLVVMSLSSSIFIAWVFSKLKFSKLKIALFLTPVVLTLFVLHPDYLSYYSPIFGGIKVGSKVIEPKWIIGTKEIVRYFKNVQRDNNMDASYNVAFESLVYKKKGVGLDNILTVGFDEKYYSQIWPFFREFGAWAVVKDYNQFAQRTKFFVYPVWADAGVSETRFTLRYVDTISLRGALLYNVYINESLLK